VDAEAYRKRLEGSKTPVHRQKELHYIGPPTFLVKDGAFESLPEEIAEVAAPLGDVPSVVEYVEPGGWGPCSSRRHAGGDTC
jgi:hypothetical protein